MASKLSIHEPHIFLHMNKEISENGFFYSETKRDIGMGHKRSNDGYAKGTKRLFGEIFWAFWSYLGSRAEFL